VSRTHTSLVAPAVETSSVTWGVARKRKALPGEVPQREEPKLREHVWSQGGISGTDAFGAPSWLNSEGGNVARSCLVCGCEVISEGASVRADAKVVSGKEWVYRDYKGHEIRSFVELSCPVIEAPGGGAAAVALEHARIGKVKAEKADIRAEHAEYRISQIEAENRALREETMARITQLEAENRALKEQVGSVTQIDLGQLAEKLYELAEAAKARKALESVESKGRVVQIPKELADVIDVVGIPVEGEVVEDEDDG